MAFPSKGDRVVQQQYGPGTVMEIDTYHTVIEFDAHGTRRFATNLVVLAPTKEPGPSAIERREAMLARAREERRQQRAAMAPAAKATPAAKKQRNA
jgi:hypothetical protein